MPVSRTLNPVSGSTAYVAQLREKRLLAGGQKEPLASSSGTLNAMLGILGITDQ